MAANRINECESVPAKAELVEIEIVFAKKMCRRRASRATSRLPKGIVAGILASHLSEQSLSFSTAAHSEHAFRNGGIGAPLRC